LNVAKNESIENVDVVNALLRANPRFWSVLVNGAGGESQ
jgi:hypothetical protein